MTKRLTNRNRIILSFLLLLANHVAHVFEEVWAGFWLLNTFGPGRYLVTNWILFCLPLLLFYFVLESKRWAYRLSIAYAGFMAFQGIGHNVLTMITGKYFNGYGGGYTGIGFMIIGPLLVYHILQEMRTTRIFILHD